MKLLNVVIHSAPTCGGLLDGLNVSLRRPTRPGYEQFDPVCLIGQNGAGKSQLLQIIAEAFQSAWNVCRPTEERVVANGEVRFTIDYEIRRGDCIEEMRIERAMLDDKPRLYTNVSGEWEQRDLVADGCELLPAIIVGYTSGENETLSLPFLVSRSAYADEVAVNAKRGDRNADAADPRLMLIDYGTHFEVLLANLLLGSTDIRSELLSAARLRDLSSFRCIIQLGHSAAPAASPETKKLTGRSRLVELTDELDLVIQWMQRAATTWSYDDKTATYTLDYFVDDATRLAFRTFFGSPIKLYRSLHKISMLNDLALSGESRARMRLAVGNRHFASRLPEPPEDDKVFRFELVTFTARGGDVDYASLSDGEHQLAQILGVFAMVDHDNALFLLDEPESHFNPQWRVKFAERMGVVRSKASEHSRQDVMITTHAPFLPSDLPKESVRLFRRDEELRLSVEMPNEETFGASFDRILNICFGIAPPISEVAKDAIDDMFKIESSVELEASLEALGDSNKKALLLGRLAKLKRAGQ